MRAPPPGASRCGPSRGGAISDAFVARLSAATGALTWNTFLGGVGFDEGRGIATDTAGNIYVTGQSEVTWGAPVRAHAGVGSYDAFVARLSGATGALAWNTFLGGAGIGGPGAPGFDTGRGIVTDAAGNVYVTGYSNVTWGAPVRAYTGGSDTFVARLDAAGGALGSNTFLGAIGTDIGHGIATDAAGNVYVTGQSEATWGAPVRAYSGVGTDAFVAQLAGVGGGGGDPGPVEQVDLAVNGAASEEVTVGNPVTVTYRLRGCQFQELFLLLNAPPLGIVWSYLNAAGQWVPLPANLADITPYSTDGPADGSYPLFTGSVPVGDYELYLGCDFVKNGHLDYLLGGINGVYDRVVVRVR